jgi:hypothetical protein
VSVARLASIYAIQLYALSLMLSMLVFCFYRHGHIKIRVPPLLPLEQLKVCPGQRGNGDTLNTLMILMC